MPDLSLKALSLQERCQGWESQGKVNTSLQAEGKQRQCIQHSHIMFMLCLYAELIKLNLFSKIAKIMQVCDSVSGGYNVYGKMYGFTDVALFHSICGS